ncbi:hypothetical protein JAAARDRAFT_190380 [Jaapia argillacea MUCL 33604]|uniref:Uncharacterized protein n=1 Tax=Jaapia argillacea MUCL 33604 TaxID=933084 RepID=A0A067Q3T6_9AGAM|nr:hypothetical protein JAAARDRAFT_190380 [Jaapia argillacea MUCL 33604]
MKALLKTKGLWGLVSGTLPCPTPAVEGTPTGDEKEEFFRVWKAKEEEMTRLLWLALEDGQKVHVKGKEDDAVEFGSIRKLPDQFLTSLMACTDKGMQDLKALHPSDYTIKKLDTELLHSMALICTLPAEYATFVSSLLLLSDLDLKKLQATFQSEETQHLSCSTDSTSSLAFRASTTSHIAQKPAASMSDSHCTFCDGFGHLELVHFKKEDVLKLAKGETSKRHKKGCRGGAKGARAMEAAGKQGETGTQI